MILGAFTIYKIQWRKKRFKSKIITNWNLINTKSKYLVWFKPAPFTNVNNISAFRPFIHKLKSVPYGNTISERKTVETVCERVHCNKYMDKNIAHGLSKGENLYYNRRKVLYYVVEGLREILYMVYVYSHIVEPNILYFEVCWEARTISIYFHLIAR